MTELLARTDAVLVAGSHPQTPTIYRFGFKQNYCNIANEDRYV